jgi:hypothetical protein
MQEGTTTILLGIIVTMFAGIVGGIIYWLTKKR